MAADEEWSVGTLKEHLERLIEEQDKRNEQRFQGQKQAIDTAMTASNQAINAAMVAAEKAVTKAEMATEKRFDAVNEFRAVLTDQTATFITRHEYAAQHEALEEKVSTIEGRLNTSTGGKENSGKLWAAIAVVVGLVLTAGAIVISLI
jgi:hypothetical protein